MVLDELVFNPLNSQLSTFSSQVSQLSALSFQVSQVSGLKARPLLANSFFDQFLVAL